MIYVGCVIAIQAMGHPCVRGDDADDDADDDEDNGDEDDDGA